MKCSVCTLLDTKPRLVYCNACMGRGWVYGYCGRCHSEQCRKDKCLTCAGKKYVPVHCGHTRSSYRRDMHLARERVRKTKVEATVRLGLATADGKGACRKSKLSEVHATGEWRFTWWWPEERDLDPLNFSFEHAKVTRKAHLREVVGLP